MNLLKVGMCKANEKILLPFLKQNLKKINISYVIPIEPLTHKVKCIYYHVYFTCINLIEYVL